jgi:hypothetical protein
LPVASELRQIAEESFTTLVTSENRAARNGDTLKYLEFAAQKLDALGMRYQNIRDVSDRYSAILATEKTTAPSEIDDALFHIQGINGPLLDFARLHDQAPGEVPGVVEELESRRLVAQCPGVVRRQCCQLATGNRPIRGSEMGPTGQERPCHQRPRWA